MNDLKNSKCLLPKTRHLLLKMIDECDFLNKYVLVGGSALALHLCHRKSEDLDFFTYENGSFDKKEIFKFIKRFENKEILNQSDEQMDLLLDGVKVTFFNASWSFLKPKKIKKFNLATIESIATMKIHVLFLRAKYRDYYDIYHLSKSGMSLKKMFQHSTDILEGITYKLFVTALLYIDDIEDDDIDYLEPTEKLSKEEIRAFLQNRVQ